MKRLLAAVAISIMTSPAPAAPKSVQLAKHDYTLEVKIGDREFTTLHFDKSQPKPYFSPVLAADGAQVSRPLEHPEDHPHHKGIWCSIDEVNGIKFWAEKGKIENQSVAIIAMDDGMGRIKLVNHWLDAASKPLLIETTQVTIWANRLMAYDVRLAAADKAVTFDDTKEGLFGIRVADSLRGKAGGKIVNAEGLQGEKGCWGQESKWVDYFGDVAGKTYGVTLIDHPQNFRKSRFHVRDYGLFTLSPFGQHAYTNGKLPPDPLVLEPGKSIRLRYGLYVHDGDTEQGNVRSAYEFYLKNSGE
jgi:methane monooxygenase PmoA-like